jgi:hypothetical protein
MLYRITLALAFGLVLFLWASAVVAETDERGTSGGTEAVRPPYPTSVDSMIERRRDQRERRRDDYLDWRTGRRWQQPPWINARREWMETQEDAMAEAFRRRRDAMEAWQDNMGRWRHPWSQWQEDWDEARRDAYALDRLRREEFRDRWHYPRYPWGPFRPYW